MVDMRLALAMDWWRKWKWIVNGIVLVALNHSQVLQFAHGLSVLLPCWRAAGRELIIRRRWPAKMDKALGTCADDCPDGNQRSNSHDEEKFHTREF